jgi:hypothetical protein
MDENKMQKREEEDKRRQKMSRIAKMKCILFLNIF